MALTSKRAVLDWIDEMAAMTQPDQLVWIDGSEAQLEELRAAMPHTFFLVPGYGAQGGGAKDAAAAFDARGLGAVVNSSRGIICAWSRHKKDEREFAKAAREEALAMKEDLLRAIGHPIGEER